MEAIKKLKRNETTAIQAISLEDGDLNPLRESCPPFSTQYRELLRARRDLPVAKMRQEFLDMYHDSQVMIVVGQTGSGKTTQIPQYVLYDEWADNNLAVACTHPRRIAAASVANRVAAEMDVQLGDEVGYRIQFDKVAGKATRLLYMTDGSLVREMAKDPLFSRYCCVIIDEAHERSIDTDILLMLLKNAMVRRNDLKVIIMSATLETDVFRKYFGNVPVINIPGKSFPIDVFYLKEATLDFVIASIRTVSYIHNNNAKGDILLFLPGEEEIEKACGILRKETENLVILPIYSTLPKTDQGRIFSSSSKRKCIVATNIVETSLTIDGIVYVVDSGLKKNKVFNARLCTHIIQLGPISQASALQRAGRAGRTQAGICYRLYTEEAHGQIPKSPKPAVLTDDPSKIILFAAGLGTWLNPNKDLSPLEPEPAPSEPIDPLTDYGPPTSQSFIHTYKRPIDVGLGWGEYDRFHEWQSHGRLIPIDMVDKNRPWNVAPNGPLEFYSPTTKNKVTVMDKVDPSVLPDKEPETLFETMDKRRQKRERESFNKLKGQADLQRW